MAAKEVSEVVQRCELAKHSGILDLKGFQLTILPEAVYFLLALHPVRQCSLAWNRLAHFPAKLPTNFHTLPGNIIGEIPTEICVLHNLQALDLSRNMLMEFPSALYGLPQLRIINLSINKITSINVDTVCNSLPFNLKYLDVGGNPLDKTSVEVIFKSQFRSKIKTQAYPDSQPLQHPSTPTTPQQQQEQTQISEQPPKGIVYRGALSFVVRKQN